jgi:hypothetical protein
MGTTMTDHPTALALPVADASLLPAADLPITAATPFRAAGDCPLLVWREQFRRARSPASPATVDAMYEAAKGLTALVLDRLRAESSYAAGSLPARNNVLGLRVPGSLAFLSFESPVDCVKELMLRWQDPGYKSGVYMPRELSIRDLITKYSPPNENPTNKLIKECVANVNEWRNSPVEASGPSADPWRPYPWPTMVDLVCNKPWEGAGFDRVQLRRDRIRGFCTHITDGVGTIEGIARLFATGGERQADALTDTTIGRDGRIGLLNDWRDPNRGGTRAGWANGGVDGLEGDGVGFYRRYPDINSVLVSCEHIARAGEAWTDPEIAASIELRTAVAQSLKCPATTYPRHPTFGNVSIEQQHRNFATKSCPATPYIGTYEPIVMREVAQKLAAWQGGSVVTSPPEQTYTAYKMSDDQLAWFFGTMTRINPDGSTDELPFSPTGPLSLLWMARAEREGVFPAAETMQSWDSGMSEGREWWATWSGGWTAWLPLDNQRAGWKWLDPVQPRAATDQ